MQLFIVLALLLYGGKGGAQSLIEEVKPMLEAFGGDDVKAALKSAEEISSVISALNPAPALKQPAPDCDFTPAAETAPPREVFPLAPISNVANREITYCLSKFVEG